MRSHFLQRLAIEPATCKPVSCGCADQGKSEDPEAVGQIGSSAWMVCLGTRGLQTPSVRIRSKAATRSLAAGFAWKADISFPKFCTMQRGRPVLQAGLRPP